MEKQLAWVVKPSSRGNLAGDWAGGGEPYTWRNVIPFLARKYFTSRLKI